MDRTQFIDAMLYSRNQKEVDKKFLDEVIQKDIEICNKEHFKDFNLIVVVEEMAELIQACTKHLRAEVKDSGHKYSVLEEYADVLISLAYIKKMVGIDDMEIRAAVNVKLNKLATFLENEYEVSF